MHYEQADLMLRSSEFCLTHDYFEIENNYYLQTRGPAIGTNCVPSYINLAMGLWEHRYIYNNSAFALLRTIMSPTARSWKKRKRLFHNCSRWGISVLFGLICREKSKKKQKQTDNPIRFVTQFHRDYRVIERIFLKHSVILQQDPLLGSLLPSKPKFVYRKALNQG